MICPESQRRPLYYSLVLHGLFFSGLLIVALLQTCPSRPPQHVFTLVTSGAVVTEALAATTTPTSELSPVVIASPEVKAVAIPDIPPAAAPARPKAKAKTKARSTKKKKAKVKPAQPVQKMSYAEFVKQHPVESQASKPKAAAVNKQHVASQLSQSLAQVNSQQTEAGVTTMTIAQPSYLAALKQQLDQAWEKPVQLSDPGLRAVVQFTVTAGGRMTAVRIIRSSGDLAFEQSILQAFQVVSSVSPPPKGAQTFQVTFRLSD